MNHQQTQSQSPLDSKDVQSFVIKLINQGETNNTIAESVRQEFGIVTTDDSIRRFRKRHGVQIPGTTRASTNIHGDTGECSTPVTTAPILDDPDAMLRQRGLDPEQWYIDSLKANQWDGPSAEGSTVTYYQTSFTVRRKRPELTLRPVRSDGWRPTAKVTKSVHNVPRLVVVCGDQQAPYHDPDLHRLFCQWLAANRPDEGVELGDLLDFPDISRHPKDPDNIASANDCLQAGYEILRDYVVASPQTNWSYIPGNHDIRLRDFVINHAPELHGLKRVDTEQERGQIVHALEHLLRLDELGMQWIDSHGPYEESQITLSKHLAVRHGWVVRQGSGASALKTLEQTGFSILVGHTHRQSLVHHTIHDINGQATTLLAAEVGCLCRLDNKVVNGNRFPSYTVLPDWQPGFCTATIWPDGKFRIDLAAYVNQTLIWRDQRYDLS